MTDKERITQLETELTKAKAASGPTAVLRSSQDLQAEQQAAVAAAKKRELQSRAKKTPDGLAHYVVGAAKAYREGRLYAAGEVISIPADELPSPTWSPLDDKAAPAAKPSEEKPKGRPSDREVG